MAINKKLNKKNMIQFLKWAKAQVIKGPSNGLKKVVKTQIFPKKNIKLIFGMNKIY